MPDLRNSEICLRLPDACRRVEYGSVVVVLVIYHIGYPLGGNPFEVDFKLVSTKGAAGDPLASSCSGYQPLCILTALNKSKKGIGEMTCSESSDAVRVGALKSSWAAGSVVPRASKMTSTTTRMPSPACE